MWDISDGVSKSYNTITILLLDKTTGIFLVIKNSISINGFILVDMRQQRATHFYLIHFIQKRLSIKVTNPLFP